METRALLLRENDRVKDNLTRICEDLTDEQVNYEHEAVDERGIGNVVSHLYGSLANRTAIVTGAGPAVTPDAPRTRGELIAFIDRTHDTIAQRLAKVTEEQLAATVTIRDRESTGIEAMMNSFSHAYRHVGNVLDARHLGGFETHVLG
ncbi:MAG: hypothetical protein HW416_1621 [Chloroflexi bacterium]|nr:hypothetical protein [Chloroflexota bacterium]